MHFKKSENIARNALEIGCDPDDVTVLDKYLAGRHRKCFTLFDAKSKTGLGNCTEPLLNEFVQEEILREPKARHLCPVHGIGLEILNDNEGKCIDCADTHLLSDCETEDVYERLVTPDTWSNGDPVMTSISADKTETSWWEDPKWKAAKWIAERIGIPIILIVAGVLIRNALTVPPESNDSLEMPTSTVQLEPSSTPKSVAIPTTKIAPTDLPTATMTPNS